MSEAQRCPVCYGKGIVPNGFYNSEGEYWMTSDMTPEKCRSCNGTGIVWETTPDYLVHKTTVGKE